LLETKRCLQYESNEARYEHEGRDAEHEDSGSRRKEARFAPVSIILMSVRPTLKSMIYVSQKYVGRDDIEYDVNACGAKQTIHDLEAVK
jgi:hypothetical protein